MAAILKGQPKTVSVKFPTGSTFPSPPEWELYDWNGDMLMSGTAVHDGGTEWSATFTLAKTLTIPNGSAEIEIEFDGITADGKYRSKAKDLTVVDVDVDWKSYGILYYPRTAAPQTIHETALYQQQPTSITAEIRNGFGAGDVLFARTWPAPVEKSSSELGYVYDIDIPNVTLPYASGGFFPHQLVIVADFGSGAPDVTAKPIYTLTPQILSHLTSIKRYLDKARLDEIDPNIGWQDEELIHYLHQGVMFINGVNDVTYWTVDSMGANNLPSNLYTHLYKAAQLEALNARYLAEGMVEFDWQGANTQLTINRRDAIQVKMDELNAWLTEQLPKAKKAAVATFGPGTPPEGIQGGRRINGGLVIGLGPMTNISVPGRPWPIYRRVI